MMRRTTLATTGAALALTLGGCSSIAGVQDAPTEDTSGASISQAAGSVVTERVIGEAAAASQATGKDADKRQQQVLVGPALKVSSARASVKQSDDKGTALETPAETTVLAVSKGTGWPRSILATSRADEVQQLHVLVADGPKEAYHLFATVPMASGASIPAFADPAEGVAVTPPEGIGEDDLGAARDWAKAVAYPAPKKAPESVATDDTFSTALQTNAAKQAKELDELAKYTVEHSVGMGGSKDDPADAIRFELADGGHLTIAGLTRTDKVTATDKAKELTLPGPLAELADDDTITEDITVKHLEVVALVEPKDGKASVVGALEQLSDVSST